MSLVAISHHNENIRNILEPPKSSVQGVQAVARTCSYISKHRPRIIKDEKKVKECHKTFGYAQVPLPKPCEFLRKNSRIVPPRPVIPAKPKCCLTCRKPCLPACPVIKKEAKPDKTKAWEEDWKAGRGKRYPCPCPNENETEEAKKQTSMEKVCGKNFEVENIHKIVQSVPKEPVPKYVDSKKGHSQSLLHSGLLPIYVHKKCYGKIPGYILSRKGKVAMKKDQTPCQQVAESGEPVVYAIPDEERQVLLEGLRKNWNELQAAYQHMPILIDTMHKRLRKDRLEKELRRLELNISNLERHEQIYVLDDEQYP